MNEPSDTAADAALWMRQALREAEMAAQLGEVPVGAVVERAGEIIGRGHNRSLGGVDPTAHAEVRALRDAARRLGNHRLPGCRLFVTVEPCLMCAGALVHARIDTLIYGAPEPKAGAVASRTRTLELPWLNHRVAVVPGVLGDECAMLMKRFFAERRVVSASGVAS